MEAIDLMSYEDFKWQLKQSYKGANYLIFALFMGFLFFGISQAEDSIWPPIIGILIVAIGFLVFIRGIRNRYLIKKETHPLLLAIKNEDKQFIIWMFTVDKQERHDANIITPLILKLKDKNGKTYSLSLTTPSRTRALTGYFKACFDIEFVGNEKATRKKAIQKLKAQKKA